MKKLILIPLLFTAHVHADDYVYAGGSVSIQNITEYEEKDISADDNSELGFNLTTGYNFTVSSYLDFGLELEHQVLGKTEFNDTLSVKGNLTYLNARPKFIEEYNNLYSSFIFGVGKVDLEASHNGQTASASGIAYQVGIEAGYMMDNLDIGIGYRYQIAEADDTDITFNGFTLGMRYNFK